MRNPSEHSARTQVDNLIVALQQIGQEVGTASGGILELCGKYKEPVLTESIRNLPPHVVDLLTKVFQAEVSRWPFWDDGALKLLLTFMVMYGNDNKLFGDLPQVIPKEDSERKVGLLRHLQKQATTEYLSKAAGDWLEEYWEKVIPATWFVCKGLRDVPLVHHSLLLHLHLLVDGEADRMNSHCYIMVKCPELCGAIKAKAISITPGPSYRRLSERAFSDLLGSILNKEWAPQFETHRGQFLAAHLGMWNHIAKEIAAEINQTRHLDDCYSVTKFLEQFNKANATAVKTTDVRETQPYLKELLTETKVPPNNK